MHYKNHPVYLSILRLVLGMLKYGENKAAAIKNTNQIKMWDDY